MQGNPPALHQWHLNGPGQTHNFRGPPLGIIQQRGTVSMPSSPLLGRYQASTDMGGIGWRAPQTAIQNEFSLPASASDTQSPHPLTNRNFPFQTQTPSAPAYEQQYMALNRSSPNHLASLQPSQTHPSLILGSDNGNSTYQPGSAFSMPSSNLSGIFPSNEQMENEGVDESGETGKKKRAQVRVACTHCQKACKKCSNTRPCERCVKYGLNDCVDSARKPRKTGIKRGPYKRRASKFVTNNQQTSNSYVPQHSYPPAHRHNQGDASATINGLANVTSPPWVLPQQQSIPAYPPGPRPTSFALTDALSAAITGPRWVNGQRVSPFGQQIPPMQVSADTEGRLPLAPGIANDPFSRAVSPIAPFSPSKLTRQRTADQIGRAEADRPDVSPVKSPSSSRVTSTRPSLSVVTSAHSRPPSAHSSHSPDPPETSSPYYVPAKIRKPSLWTLMSASSIPGSPVLVNPDTAHHPIVDHVPRTNIDKEVDSPTLFNQPMGMENLDLGSRGLDFETWIGLGSELKDGREMGDRGEAIPRRQSGQVTDGGDSARVMEGMGMAGFESLMGFN
ncbi:hypothetical protein L198_08281 [Cryptococcus wingfieldii CBS 7118]|uniref:Zn(2)-C6 fungal-type domain-containing protein n=1 Tax=Cryptococcus wingfieldii CBS 7118 TaxID=1295528 RepID=A0A1E3HBB8_9TREE|nr:hypothetical protein L198_08281 [Cryptococcus wingfieldii CBS 7118]ODN73630.1 hypothetical protein L198_08281 [Cryptococcus wingfieldii CBS 7118]